MRVLLLTGAGRGFCAGQDLGDRAVAPGDAPVDLGASIERNYKPLVLGLRALPMPVVCAVNGVAAGRGRQPRARVRHRHRGASRRASSRRSASIGLVPDSGGTYFLPRLVGARARARPLAARRQARRRSRRRNGASSGNASTTPSCRPHVEALAAQLAQAPTRGLAAIKEALQAAAGNTLDAQLDVERDLQRELGNGDDYREGVAAFLAKRPPHFSGR